MPTLNRIGKAAVIEHHKEVLFRLLKCREDLSVGDPQVRNLLVQSDNLEALKALLPYYPGPVKCTIDPSYNTGNEGWVYNDAVNSIPWPEHQFNKLYFPDMGELKSIDEGHECAQIISYCL